MYNNGLNRGHEYKPTCYIKNNKCLTFHWLIEQKSIYHCAQTFIMSLKDFHYFSVASGASFAPPQTFRRFQTRLSESLQEVRGQ